MSVGKEVNAAIAIAARDLLRLRRDWKETLLFSFFFPVAFLGLLGGLIAENLASGLPFNFLQFALVGMVACMGAQYTTMNVTSLVEERETGLTQEIFVAPVSRFTIIAGKILGGSATALLQVAPFFLVAGVLGAPLNFDLVAGILWVLPLALLLGGAMGVLLAGIFATSPKSVDQAVIMVLFPQMFLSGAVIPISQSSGWLHWLVRLMPVTYLVDLMRTSAYRGTSVYGAFQLYAPWVDVTVLLAVSLAFFIVGTRLFASRERNR